MMDEYFRRKMDFSNCKDDSIDALRAQEAEYERIESLLENLIPCQHCFDTDVEWLNSNGQVAIICLNCGCSTGLSDTHQESIDLWQGLGKNDLKFNHTARTDAYVALVDMYDDGAVVEEKQAHMITYVLCKIWNNEVPGVRFENGGSRDRKKAQ